MANLSLVFDILAKDRASKEFRKVGDSVSDAGRKADGFGSKFGSIMGGVAKAAAVGLGAAAAGVAAFGVSAVRAASEGEQSLGAIESVFGDATDAVKRFSQDSSMRLGLSQNAYRELAAVVGSQLKNMGKSQAEAAVTTDELISLGADLAATFGGSVSDAVGAVGSLLRGERDPIERYGIAIKDADIKARLAATGQDKLKGAALKTATAQATLKMLTEQAGGALGAFGRESNTLAGTQERLRARVADVKEQIGNQLLPIATRFAGWLLREGVPAFERLVRKIEDNRVEIGNFAVASGKALASIGQAFLLFLQATLAVLAKATAAYGVMVKQVFGFARGILTAMEASLGWLPGFDKKFKAAGIILDVYEDQVGGKIAGASAAFAKGAQVAGAAAGAVGGLRGQIDALRPKVVEAKANVVGKDNIRDMRRAIDELRNKTVTVTTVQKTVRIAERDGRGGGLQARASGGPVLSGRPYLVGERGPELIVPQRSGYVLDAKQTAGMADGMDLGPLLAEVAALRSDIRNLPRDYQLGRRQMAVS